MILNMETTAIKYHFPTFYIQKDKFLVIFVIVAVLFAKNKKKCDGHQFLEFIELIYQFERQCVQRKLIYYEYFYFYNFKLTSDVEMTLKPTKIKSWRMLPVDIQIVSNLTYSQRLSFFR